MVCQCRDGGVSVHDLIPLWPLQTQTICLCWCICVESSLLPKVQKEQYPQTLNLLQTIVALFLFQLLFQHFFQVYAIVFSIDERNQCVPPK